MRLISYCKNSGNEGHLQCFKLLTVAKVFVLKAGKVSLAINPFPQSNPCLKSVICSFGIFQTSYLIPVENIALSNQESQ